MAVVVKEQYNCGCGFRTSKATDAIEHVRKTGHQMVISGSIAKVEDDGKG